jgi:hypothetical protein
LFVPAITTSIMRFRALAFDYQAEAVFVAEEMERRHRGRDSVSTTSSEHDETEMPNEVEDMDFINSPFSLEELTAQAMLEDGDADVSRRD